MPLDVLSMVGEPTWREFLVDLVASRQMDPWDIDIVAVADAYLARVKQLQAMDLRVPANVILACALLLRFKSQTISFEPEPAQDYYEESPQLISEDVPELAYRSNLPRNRRVTLQELLAAVEEVVRDGPRPVVRVAAPRELNIELPRVDMHELMAHVLGQLSVLKDADGVVLFSQLVGHGLTDPKIASTPFNKQFSSPAEAIVLYLLPVLHLVQEQRLYAWQDDYFGEVFIKVLPGPQAGGKNVSKIRVSA